MEHRDTRHRLGSLVADLSHASTIGTEACSGLIGVLLLVIVRSLSEFFRLKYLHGEALVIGQVTPSRWRASLPLRLH